MNVSGSAVNNIYGNASSPNPELGMGATILMWTDRIAATVVHVSRSGREIDVREDHAVRTDDNGMSESQDYEYSRNPNGRVHTYTLRKNGRWVRQGESMKGGQRLLLGQRRAYHDFSF